MSYLAISGEDLYTYASLHLAYYACLTVDSDIPCCVSLVNQQFATQARSTMMNHLTSSLVVVGAAYAGVM